MARSRLHFTDAVRGAAYVWGFWRYLADPITLAEAQAVLARRFERRGEDFLDLIRDAVYAYPASPYARLLREVGCQYGDLARLVTHDGLEGALQVLYRQGVYLTVEELKGTKPVVRGTTRFTVGRRQLRNPRWRVPVARLEGTTWKAVQTPVHRAMFHEQAVDVRSILAARGHPAWRLVFWVLLADGVPLFFARYAGSGMTVARWFAYIDPRRRGAGLKNRWGPSLMRAAASAADWALPRPVYVPSDAPLPIVRCLADELRAGRVPHLKCSVSHLVRVCHAAIEAGIDLRGVRASVAGEPLTRRRLELFQRAGVEATSHYAARETLIIGDGCLRPAAPDDLHLLHDLHAVIQPGAGPTPDGLRPDALLASSLRPSAPLILLNASLGDRAEVVRRDCGCPLGRLGWTTHLHDVRSFEKLTARSVAIPDGALIELLESELPRRLGGAPHHYQLVEDEDEDGTVVVRLLVDPAVGPLDPVGVAEAFLAALRQTGPDGEWLARERGWLRVERRAPLETLSGKTHHVVRPMENR